VIKIKNLRIGFKNELLETGEIFLQRGKLYALIGANGKGKTTFLKTVNGAIPPISGELEIDEISHTRLSREQFARKIAFVSSKFEGVDHLRVFEYVSLGRTPFLGLFGRLTAKDREIVHSAIEQLGISKFSDRITSELSDGERQMASIARAIAQDCPIILLDEPTAFLDYLNKQKIIEILAEIASAQSKCILFSTHDLDLIYRMEIPQLMIDSDNRMSLLTESIQPDVLIKRF
jgi:iron complex transport system ATP-binding protein